jgi:hypothetical protein
MRFMMIVKANKDTEAGVMPEEKLLEGSIRARKARASSSPGESAP